MDYTKKHTFSLLALWFMAPFMNNIDLTKEGLQEEEIKFVKWYIKAGFIVWGAILIAIIISILLSRISNPLGGIISSLVWAIPVLMLIFWTFSILNNRPFSFTAQLDKQALKQLNNPVKQDIGPLKFIYYYIPLYNLYLWYTQRDNPKVYRWVKESIIFNIIILLLPTSFLMFVWIVGYITRVAFLIWGKDIIPDNTKQKLDQLFEINPEEIWGYIKGVLLYIFNSTKTGQLKKYIDQAKKEYTHLDSKFDKKLLAEYIIIFLLLLPGILTPYALLYSGWWIWRYALAIYLKKLPYIPLIHEVVEFLYSIASKKNVTNPKATN